MATPEGKAVMSKQVNKSFRDKFEKQTDFWKELEAMFVAMAAEITISRLAELKREFPLAREFVEEELVWENS